MNPFEVPKKLTQLQIELIASMMQEEAFLREEQEQQAEYKAQMSKSKRGLNY